MAVAIVEPTLTNFPLLSLLSLLPSFVIPPSNGLWLLLSLLVTLYWLLVIGCHGPAAGVAILPSSWILTMHDIPTNLDHVGDLHLMQQATDGDSDAFAQAEARQCRAQLPGRLARQVDALPEKLRKAFELTIVGQMRVPQAAERLGCTTAALRMRLRRAVALLAQSLEPQDMAAQ